MIAADLDGDGRMAVLFGCDDGKLHALGERDGKPRCSGPSISAAASASRSWPTSPATAGPRSSSRRKTGGFTVSGRRKRWPPAPDRHRRP